MREHDSVSFISHLVDKTDGMPSRKKLTPLARRDIWSAGDAQAAGSRVCSRG
jgi:hypothetical protein